MTTLADNLRQITSRRWSRAFHRAESFGAAHIPRWTFTVGTRLSGVGRYAVALAATALAVLATTVIAPWLDGTILPLPLAAVVLGSLLGGLGPGLVSTALAALALKYLFLPEAHTLFSLTASSAVRLLLFLGLALPLVAVAAALRSTVRMLDSALRLRSEMLAIVSHDLRNPLGAILISSAALRDSAPPEAAGECVRAAASRIHHSATRMNRLIHDLLDLSRIEARTIEMKAGDHQFEDILADEWDVLEALASEKQVQLNRTLTAGLVRCDRTRIGQVIENLVGNAIKFTPSGGQVRVGTESAGPRLRVFVEDTGCGIAQKDQSRIFDRYWKGGESTSDGAGLGLAIAKAIVEAHGGRLEVESRPGAGSRFAFGLAVAGPRVAPPWRRPRPVPRFSPLP